jgi:hypothetical protein
LHGEEAVRVEGVRRREKVDPYVRGEGGHDSKRPSTKKRVIAYLPRKRKVMRR